MSSVTLSRGDYDDVVVATGFKYQVVLRGGQYLVMEKNARWPVRYGDHGSTRGSRENAMYHFQALEAPYYEAP